MFYRDCAPTGFDRKGAFLREYGGWRVAPVGINRDTDDPLTLSNWHMCLEMLGGESEAVEVHRFGHWACGWFEIILVAPEAFDTLDKIEDALESYPVLSEEDFSEREVKHVEATWEAFGVADRVNALQRCGASIFAARSDSFPWDADSDGSLFQYLSTP